MPCFLFHVGKPDILFYRPLTHPLTPLVQIRRLWRHYFEGTDCLIYVVDSNDRDRIGEARDELHRMMGEEELRESALLVFANKQDLPNAMSSREIAEKLGLAELGRGRQMHIQATCATSGEGLYEGLDWVASYMSKRKH